MSKISARPAQRLITLSLLAIAWAVIASLSVPPAIASHSQITFFEAPRDLLNSATRHKAFLQLETLGVKDLRLELHWHDVAPNANSKKRPKFNARSPASYDWGAYDAVMSEARRLGWKVLLTVTSPVPRWATAAKRDLITRPEDRQFDEFMTAVGLHYGSMVSWWALWNEPNIAGWLMPQWNSNGTPASPRVYRGLWQAGYAGLKAAGLKSPRVLFGETSPFGQDHANIRTEGGKREVAPLEFMREALCLDKHYRKASTCGELQVSGYAQHPYTYPAVQGPYYRPPERDEVTIGTLPRLSKALALAGRAHAIPVHQPIYLTEFGVESKPNPLGVSPSEQAEYDAVSEKIAWEDPQVLTFSQYLLTDEPQHGRLRGYRTGLETARRARKPLYYAFPVPLVVSKRRSGYSLWGLVRPADGITRVHIYVELRGSRHFRSLAIARTNSLGYWTHYSSTPGSRWRVSWRSPSGAIYTGPPIRASR